MRLKIQEKICNKGCEKEKYYTGNLSAVRADLRVFVNGSYYQLRFSGSLRSCLLPFTPHAEVLSLPCSVTVWVFRLFLIWVNTYL